MQGQGGGPPRHPIDKGWAWMVCLGAFGLNFFVNGGLRSMGLLFIELLKKYQADKSLTSLTLAVLAGGFAIFSAIGNAVGAVKTMRTACLFGSVMMFLGMFLTYFAPNIYVVIACLGLISGIGYGFTFGPCMVMVGQYFVKRRSLANGLAAAGGSVGTLLIPFFVRASMDEFGFSGTVLIYSAIILHAIPASMLLRPVSFYNRRTPVPTEAQPLKPGPPGNVPEITVTKSDETSEKTKEELTYELRGSKIIEVPVGGSVEKVAISEPILEVKDTSAPPPPPANPTPPGPPPKPTLGLVMKMFFKKMFDKETLKMWAYLAYLTGLSVGHGGYISNCMYIPPYAMELWKSEKTASLMITILGVADLVGRVSGGWFADLNLVRKPFIIGFSFVVSGAATIIVPFLGGNESIDYPAVIVYMIILGLLGGTYMAQLVVIVTELVGPLKTPAALGLATMMMGFTVIPLVPIMSEVAKAAGTLSASLRLSGALLVTGGILFYMIPPLQKWQAAYREKKSRKKKTESNI